MLFQNLNFLLRGKVSVLPAHEFFSFRPFLSYSEETPISSDAVQNKFAEFKQFAALKTV